jgi:hypothetical protein
VNFDPGNRASDAPVDAIRAVMATKESGGVLDYPAGRRERTLLLAEELALIATDPTSAQRSRATASQLSPCLAGLLLAELLLDGVVVLGKQANTVQLTDRPASTGSTLASVAKVVADKGPKLKTILCNMDRGLREEIGLGIWGVSALGLVEAGVLTPLSGGRGFHYKMLSATARDEVVDRLRTAASKKTLEPRTALLLSMAGLAGLLPVLVPAQDARAQAQRRIDRALDGSQLRPLQRVTKRIATDSSSAATGSLSLVAS